MEASKLRAEVSSFIKSVCKEAGVSDFSITNIETNQKGEGFLGEIFMITVKDKKSSKQLDILIKAAFTDDGARDLAPVEVSFKNEVYFYQDVLPTFQKLERDHKVTQYPEIVPKCFKSYTEAKKEMLALENMKPVGFEIFDKKEILDHEHIELIFKTYGRFHAYSFALRDQNLQKYSKLVKEFCNIYRDFMVEGYFGEYLVDVGKFAQAALIPGEDDAVIKDLKKYEGRNIINIFKNSIVDECDYSAILHGDCWSNNMLFRYENVGSRRKPCEIRVIDWQAIKTGSPACDLSYCLYSGAGKEAFDKIDDYLKIYYDSFSTFLKKLGGDPKKLFPFTALEEHWKKYSKFGMIMAFGLVRMKLMSSEEVTDFRDGVDKQEFVSAFFKGRCNEKEYNKRIRELLRHMHDIGAL